ncbi:GIY-YIG nuclease family protein [Nitratireductor sp. GISD-1A_MAKvit]|uniref:GIY-YIG nuclease family protein n=1 Tax=Nitratireductor sp. GISD-1A_MAKvit TaxID=3234198 RepID=UPI003466699F
MNDFTLNELLERRGANLDECRVVRHDMRALKAWLHSRAQLEHFIGYQKIGNRTPYRGASKVFQFVPQSGASALFVGAYRILDEWSFPEDTRQPILHDPTFGENDDHPHLRYDLERLPGFEDLVGRLVIDWGGSTRAWSQWPKRQDKPIIELRSRLQEPAFPGFSNFHSNVDEIELLPEAWRGALSSVRGVYLLVCPTSGEQYVGSAYGEDGFFGRWRAYGSNGHGGNLLLMSRARSNYSVSILEVASPDMSASDIIRREGAWKTKLGSRAHGLNAN